MNIGDRIKDIRVSKKMSISELSRQSNVNTSYISKLERGIHTKPSIDILFKLSTALDVDFEELISHEEVVQKDNMNELNELLNENPELKPHVLNSLNKISEMIMWEFYRTGVSSAKDLRLENIRIIEEICDKLSVLSMICFGESMGKNNITIDLFNDVINSKDRYKQELNDLIEQLFKNQLIKHGYIKKGE